MTSQQIVAIVFGAVLLFFAAFTGGLCWLAPRIKHRGEEADAPAKPTYPRCAPPIPGADDACALTLPLPQPLEHVPPIRHPGLWAREEEMAGTPAARLATRLTDRSTR